MSSSHVTASALDLVSHLALSFCWTWLVCVMVSLCRSAALVLTAFLCLLSLYFSPSRQLSFIESVSSSFVYPNQAIYPSSSSSASVDLSIFLSAFPCVMAQAHSSHALAAQRREPLPAARGDPQEMRRDRPFERE